jgi:septal ring factor EnvC (AmiA/AmiB activator)
MRGVSVKVIETLVLGSVIDEAGQFREYNKAFHARGLLYCAAMNEAMNDHLAQFVKGAHILTAATILVLVIAAVPTSVMLSSLPSPLSQTKIIGPVDVSSPELIAARDNLANLKQDIGKLLSNSRTVEDDLKRLEAKVESLDAKLSTLQKGQLSH